MRIDHQNLKHMALSDPDIKKHYASLEEEFSILEEFIRARRAARKDPIGSC